MKQRFAALFILSTGLMAQTPDKPLPPLSEGESGKLAEVYRLPGEKKLVITFQVADTGSGASQLFLKINEGRFLALPENTLTLKNDGTYNLQWYGTDVVGNRSEVKVRNLLIDSTAPSLTATLEDSKQSAEGHVAASARLRLQASDALSGLKLVRWRNGLSGTWNVYGDAIVLKNQPYESIGLIQYQAVDKAGNESDVVNFNYILDSIPPAMPPVFDRPQPVLVPNEGLLVQGLEKDSTLQYKIDNGQFLSATEGEVIRFPANGAHTLLLRMTDSVGNKQEKTIQVMVDRLAPQSEIKAQ
jgi:hypothetical protein